jgi:molybdopterin adenylyltransferase
MAKLDETRPFIPVGIAVLTVSDTRTPADDKSGDTLAARITEAGHKLVARDIVKDDSQAIYDRVKSWTLEDEIDVVITTGGTGFTGRDVTPEALLPLFDKTMDGFSAIFHRISYDKIGTSTIQSRATGGVANATFIFVLPGSPGACKDAWDGILKDQLDYRALQFRGDHAPARRASQARRQITGAGLGTLGAGLAQSSRSSSLLASNTAFGSTLIAAPISAVTAAVVALSSIMSASAATGCSAGFSSTFAATFSVGASVPYLAIMASDALLTNTTGEPPSQASVR